MNASELIELLYECDVTCCRMCGEPVECFFDLCEDREPSGVLFNGEPFCVPCLLAFAQELRNQPHPLTLKKF